MAPVTQRDASFSVQKRVHSVRGGETERKLREQDRLREKTCVAEREKEKETERQEGRVDEQS